MLTKSSCKSIRYYSSSKCNFYITTPIYYVNASPHIGHLYTSLIADAHQRWQRLLKPQTEVVFVTGTDEHGTKIQQASANSGSDILEYCTRISNNYKYMSDIFNIKYSKFIRTTDLIHEKSVQHFWNVLKTNGHVYSSNYKGWYCVSDETFLTETQIKEIINTNGEKVKVSIENGHPVEWTEEQNYMFRLSVFQNDLIYWLTNNENVVKPKKFQKILLDMLSNEELPNISVSRPTSRVHWGIRVPEDSSHTVYVWLDALINYLTAAGYPNIQDQEFKQNWPPDVHIIGKDILKFHGIYWPAFLLAANLELPKCLLCHSHWTVDGEKMSKSKHNIVCPIQRSDFYTTEGLRYFLLREGVAHSDGNYSDIKLTRILNSELADTLGNLLNRCSGPALNIHHEFPEISSDAYNTISNLEVTKNLIEHLELLQERCFQHYSEYNFYKVIDSVVAVLHIANQFFNTLKPWILKKEDKIEQLHVVLHMTFETLRICSIILQPIVPSISKHVLDTISTPAQERTWDSLNNYSWNNINFVRRSLAKNSGIVFKKIAVQDEKQTFVN